MKWLVIILLGVSLWGYSQPSGYSFGKQLLIQASQVSGSTNHINFPVLVSLTDPDLRTVTNGGKLENVNGFDVLFTIGDCSSQLDHQIEKYDPVTGEYIAWVLLPSLSPSSNTNLHMYYGNSAISIDPSTTNVWSADYGAVWHMNQSPVASAPQITDYTSNNNDGAASGAMTASDLVIGKIGNGIDFDGSNDFLDCGNNSSLDPQLNLTVSAWIFSRAASGHIINRGGGWNDPGYSLFHLSNGIRIELQRTGEKDIIDNSLTIGVWHHTALTYNNATGSIKCFIDGVQQTNVGIHTGPIGLPTENLNIARKQKNNFYFNGIIDEGRVSFSEKSADWIATEYANQNNPSSFYSLSAEMSASDICANFLPVEWLNFSAEINNNKHIELNWQTASEINNNYFSIERSVDGLSWSTLAEVDGAGNSSQVLNYSYTDYSPFEGISFYRIKQTDFDGKFDYSNVKVVELNSEINHTAYPNPFSKTINISSASNRLTNPKIYDVLGQDITSVTTIVEQNNTNLTLDLSRLQPGVYFVLIDSSIIKIYKK